MNERLHVPLAVLVVVIGGLVATLGAASPSLPAFLTDADFALAATLADVAQPPKVLLNDQRFHAKSERRRLALLSRKQSWQFEILHSLIVEIAIIDSRHERFF